MEKTMYHPIVDEAYLGIVTFLDYEVSVRNVLWDSGICVAPSESVVDLADGFLREKPEILSHSMLSEATQEAIMKGRGEMDYATHRYIGLAGFYHMFAGGADM